MIHAVTLALGMHDSLKFEFFQGPFFSNEKWTPDGFHQINPDPD